MKKFILFIASVAIFAMCANAQMTEPTKFFDNTYVGINAGASMGLHGHSFLYDDVADGIQPVAGLRLGKWFTPSVGVEIEGEAGFGTFNTTTVVDHSLVGANFLLNANNLILGYQGQPKRVEVVPFVGIGWWHSYGDTHFGQSAVCNWIYGRGGTQININLGKKRAWQFNIIPSITYLLASNMYSETQRQHIRGGFNSNRAYVCLEVGFTYKFKNKQNSHNFVISDKRYTQEELNAKINEALAQQQPTERIVERVVEKEVVKNVVRTVEKTFIVTFAQGSAELSTDAKATLDNISGVVSIRAYASPEGTAMRNQTLSEERAEVIKNYLENNGVEVKSAIGCGVFGNTSNRIAVVTLE